MTALRKYNFLLFIFIFLLSSCVDDFDFNPDDSTDIVEKFLGTWHVSDQADRLNYDVVIVRNSNDSTSIILKNFADMRGQAIGYVFGNNVVIGSQNIGGGMMCEGTGNYINSGELRFNFILDDGIDSESRIGYFSK